VKGKTTPSENYEGGRPGGPLILISLGEEQKCWESEKETKGEVSPPRRKTGKLDTVDCHAVENLRERTGVLKVAGRKKKNSGNSVQRKERDKPCRSKGSQRKGQRKGRGWHKGCSCSTPGQAPKKGKKKEEGFKYRLIRGHKEKRKGPGREKKRDTLRGRG